MTVKIVIEKSIKQLFTWCYYPDNAIESLISEIPLLTIFLK